MSTLDPLEGLLALGVITRDMVREAENVDPSVATTIIGRLVAVGATASELLQAVSQLSGIPLATPAMLDAVQPIEGIAPALEKALLDLPGAPLGRGADGVLDIVVGEPQAIHQLAALGVPRHRAWLALEFHVREAQDRAFPIDDAGDGDVDDAPAPQATARAPSGKDAGPAIMLVPFSAGAPPVDEPVPMERAKPVREKYAPGAKPVNEAPPPPSAGADPFAFMNASPAAAASGLSLSPSPARPAAAGAAPAAPGSAAARPRPASSVRPAPPAPAPRSKAPLVALGLVVVGGVVAAVVLGPRLAGGTDSAAPASPADALAAKQTAGLAQANAAAARGDHAWAITYCSDVVQLSATTALGKEAALVCAEERVKNGDIEGLDELKALVASLAASDPLRARADAALARLKPTPTAVVTDGVVDAGVAPPKQRAPNRDLDADGAAAAKKTKPSPPDAPGGDGSDQ